MQTYKNPKLSKCIPSRNIDIDWNLLKNLLMFRTHSMDEKALLLFSDYLTSYINSIANALIEKDTEGNLYITKGKADFYPCVVAHTDINQDEIENVSIIQTSKFILGLNNDEGTQCGIGADDRCGIYFGLHCLKTMDNVKVLFTSDEEVGGYGAHACDLTFFEDVSFMIQLDRNSFSNDISYYTNGINVVSEEFVEASQSIVNKYHYIYTKCMYTDIGILAGNTGICAVNISCGYINEHYENEVISVPHFINAIGFADELINNLELKKWELFVEPEVYHLHKEIKFNKEDNEYIQGCIDVGECPVCNSNQLELLANGTVVCDTCEGYFNIKNKYEKEYEDWY